MSDPSPPEHGPPAADTPGPRVRPEALAALVLLTFLLVGIAPALGPVWILAGLTLMLAPFRRHSWAGRILVTAGLLVLFWAIGELRLVLAPFIVALILAYILDPVVDAMGRARIPRPLAAALLLLVVLIVTVVAAILVVPPAIHGLSTLAAQASEQAGLLVDRIRPWLERLPTRGAASATQEYLPQLAGWLQKIGGAVLQGLASFGRHLSTAGQIFSFLIITPILLFYLLVDIDRIRERAVELVPRRHRGQVQSFLAELDSVLASYFRGQLVVSAIVGAATGTLLAVADIPHALTLGLATGLLNLVPIVGFWISLAIAILATALGGGSLWPAVLWIALIYVGVQQVEGHILSPRIVGREVGLHPVFILLGIIGFGSLFGFVGVLVAVPLTALGRMVVTRVVAAYRASGFYGRG